MKKSLGLTLAVLGLTAGTLHAQTERSAWSITGRGAATTFATDYQSIGINPSNLGWSAQYEGSNVTLGIMEGGVSVFSEALAKPELRENLTNFGDNDKFTAAEKRQAAQDFADAGFGANIDVNWLGVSVQTERAGGFAFAARERFQFYGKLGSTASEILFQGFNSSYFDQSFFVGEIDNITGLDTIATTNPDSINFASVSVPNPISRIIDGTRINMSWMREYNVSYGVRLVDGAAFQLYGGVGLKYIQGLGILDIVSEGGQLTAFSALTPGIGIDYGSAAANNPSTITDTSNFSSVGDGFGIDLGTSMIIGGRLKIGASITDIGSVTWDGNVYQANDTLLISTDNPGFNSLNVPGELGDLVGDNGIIAYDGLQERKVSLPTQFRFGMSYRFGEIAELGFDLVTPLNEEAGNLEAAVFAIGGDISPLPWVRISAGITTGGNYGTNYPAGLTLIVPSGIWEVGVATRDLGTLLGSAENPTVSLAAGILRFRF